MSTQPLCDRCKTRPALHGLANSSSHYEHICDTCLDPAEILAFTATGGDENDE